MEILELTNNPADHPFYVAAQFHPEFKSRCAACLAHASSCVLCVPLCA